MKDLGILLKNVGIIMMLNLLVKPIYIFFIDRNVQNLVGPADYGAYFTYVNIALIFLFLSDYGLTNYIRSRWSNDKTLIQQEWASLMGLKVGLAILFSAVVYLFALNHDVWQNYSRLLWWIVGSQISLSFITTYRSMFAARGLFKIDSLFSVLEKVFLVLILGYLMYISRATNLITIELFALTIFWVQLFVLAIAVFVFHRKEKVSFRINLGQNIRQMLKKSWPFALTILLMTSYTRLDAIMINQLMINGNEQAGIYASSYRILDAINMMPLLFANFFIPIVARQENKTEIKSLSTWSGRLILSIALVISIATYFFGHDISQLLYTDYTHEWGRSLQLLVLSFIPISAMYVYSSILTATNKLKQMNMFFVLSILLNIGLNFLWIQELGQLGACWATLVTQSFIALITWVICYQKNYVSFDGSFVVKAIFLVAILTLTHYLFSKTSLPWIFQYVTLLTIGGGYCLVAGILPIKKLKTK